MQQRGRKTDPGRPRSVSRNRWEDAYARRARKEGFPARSVYKLQEIQKRFRILKPGHRVLDLGCAPGSWLLYVAELVGPQGAVVGVDSQKVRIDSPATVKVLEGDILDPGPSLLVAIGSGYDVVLSDMAPNTSGVKRVDALKSAALCESALGLARSVLLPGGSFVCKIFQGEDFDPFLEAVKRCFGKQRIFKPLSSRKASREIYIVAMLRRGGGHVRA